MQLKIAIMGTRGIPNRYGGYEQVASCMAPGLAELGHNVTVYNSHNHPYQENKWNGVEIVHCYDPENKIGTAGQFIYDLNCIRHARQRNYDVILALGYTSSSVWGWLYPASAYVISNMDGLEWKRSKYSPAVRKFLRYAEKLAIRYSQNYIADSRVIKDYLHDKYGVDAKYIPYGATMHTTNDKNRLLEFGLTPHHYYLMIARLEPENNIEMILDGYCQSGTNIPFVVVGNTSNKYGKKLLGKYGTNISIHFVGACFDQVTLHNLRHYCKLYFHGHSVGGTNPSLLDAMASETAIAAHSNPFNRAVTGNDALYFSTIAEATNLFNKDPAAVEMIAANLEKIKKHYNWTAVIAQYDCYIQLCYSKKLLHQENTSIQLAE